MKSLNLKNEVILNLINSILKRKLSRNLLQPQLDKFIRKKILEGNTSNLPELIIEQRYYAFHAMYMSYFRNYDKGYISPKASNNILKTLIESAIIGDKKCLKSIELFQRKYKQLPPNFITISPTKKCNLSCNGCYATSKEKDSETINWSLLNKIIEDAYSNMGIRFFVISGGEPLLYKSENKNLLDLAIKWSDCFFLMYTNGTLINDEIASYMAFAGNITPAISIEGSAPLTDRRRSNGVYQKIISAKKSLIKKGVPFGLSVTATKDNIDLLLSENFYKYYFSEFGASYMWVFQYMPIGRNFTTDLMISPEQRLDLFKIQNEMLIQNDFFVADFWNSALISNGCIANGKSKGYFYINWDGNIMPCVFIPHFNDNINSLYNSGKTLSDALFSPLFVEGRKWQTNYLQNNDGSANLLTPCLYRDHYKDFVEIAKRTGAKPENQAAINALKSKEYYNVLLNFDEQLDKLSLPVWEKIKKNK